ncbi:unnamed protein product [Closterium sp. Naga37s-1]|nr:unnamed protein product [Closterium sp. Naga37s-1]
MDDPNVFVFGFCSCVPTKPPLIVFIPFPPPPPPTLLCPLRVRSFGVLMLVVLTGHSPHTSDGEKDGHILQWVEECISANNSGGLKEMDMDAPDDAVLRLAQLAFSCTAERTASRPNMSYVASELRGIRHEVVGKEELSAAVKVDELAKERRIGISLRKSLGAELEAIVSMEDEEEE